VIRGPAIAASVPCVVVWAIVLWGCSRPVPAPAKITQFRVTPTLIPKGISGKLCYGVENAVKVDLNPPVEELLPSTERCIDISPAQATTYTLTAHGADGSEVSKSLDVRVGNPAPRLSDLSATPTEVKRGGQVQVCFTAENARDIKVSKGKLTPGRNCLTDRPNKTTSYKITVFGADREQDSGTVTVTVR
jgi:hypothetical protein